MFYEPLIVNETPYRITSRWDHYPVHWHSELELHICTQGSFCLELEGQQYTLMPGYALLIPSYAAHALVSSTPDFGRVTATFGYGLLGNEFKSIQNTFLHIPIDAPSTPELMRQAFRLILDGFLRYGHMTAENDWQIRSGLLLLAAGLRNHSTQQQMPEAQQNRAQHLDSIYAVLEYVARHYAQQLTVEDAAEIAGYAKTYFCRQFKQTTGVTFHRYLNQYRISTACMLLQDQKMSISDIARQTGFSSAKLFCRTFKEITGMTTGQYQKLPPDAQSIHWLR